MRGHRGLGRGHGLRLRRGNGGRRRRREDHRRGGHGRRRPLSGVFHAGIPGGSGLWRRGLARALGSDAAQVRLPAQERGRGRALQGARHHRGRPGVGHHVDGRRGARAWTNALRNPGLDLLAKLLGNKPAGRRGRTNHSGRGVAGACDLDGLWRRAVLLSGGEARRRPRALGPRRMPLSARRARGAAQRGRPHPPADPDGPRGGLVERLPDGRYSPTKEYLLGQND